MRCTLTWARHQELCASPTWDEETYRRGLALRGYSFHPTSDDWCPSFNGPEDRAGGGLVGVYLPGDGRVVVTGADDLACDRQFGDEDEARGFVLRLPSVVTMSYLAARGFVFG